MKKTILAFRSSPAIWLAVIALVVVSAVYLVAQQPETTFTKDATLNDAISLLKGGKPSEAKELIATMDASAPEYPLAQAYNALCQFELKDKTGFLQSLEKADLKKLPISAEMREDLFCKQIDALFYCRKFEDIFSQIETFKKEHPESKRLESVKEFQLAALYERGMKKTTEACSMGDQAQFQRRWIEGKANLEEFVKLASESKLEGYSSVPKHVLTEDVWVARMTLGDEKAALEEIPVEDATARERLGLLRVNLYQKLQPEKADRNLEMMTDFIKEFPESKSRKRVEFDMASVSFPRGKTFCMEAAEAEYGGDAKAAAEKRETARRYFETVRSVQKEALVDRSQKIEPSDLHDLRADMLYSYYLEKDYGQLRQLASSLISESTPGDLIWIQGKVYQAIALRMLSPETAKEAAAILDEVLALNFKNRPDHDHELDIAARWRLNIALKSGDNEKVQSLVSWVRDSECNKTIKAKFLTDHAEFTGSDNTSK